MLLTFERGSNVGNWRLPASLVVLCEIAAWLPSVFVQNNKFINCGDLPSNTDLLVKARLWKDRY